MQEYQEGDFFRRIEINEEYLVLIIYRISHFISERENDIEKHKDFLIIVDEGEDQKKKKKSETKTRDIEAYQDALELVNILK